MENQQPTGEAQNGQKKEWYKNWWGIIIAIMILPIFAIWYVWAKTQWSNKAKWITTVLIIIFSMGAVVSNEQDNNQAANQQIEQKQSVAETKSEVPAVQQSVFDVPSLIGKNIDEIKEVLGKPNIDKEPTKQQLESGVADEWEKEFEKDNQSLLVTYYPKTKVIVDFFISGTDKKALLNAGKLKENGNDYIVEFVKAIKNPSEITGVKVSKKLPQELNGNVTFNAVAFKIENKENYNWVNCKFSINSKFDFKSSDGIKANDSLIISFSDFTDDGERFNFFSNKPESLFIACDTLGQHRTNYFAIK